MITRARRRTWLVALCSVSVGMLLAGAPGAQAYVPPPAGGLAALGNNQFSNLGTSPDTDPHPAPIYFTTPGTGPVASTAASYHTSFVLSGSELYGFGDNSDGQLAQPVATQGSQNLNHPTKVALPSGAGSPVRVAASNDFTMALTNSNNLYAWGLNANGELGRTPDNTAAPTPTKVTIPVGNGVPVDVSTGSHHTLVLTSTGKVLTFGDDYYGELGYADTSGNGYDATPAALALPGNQTVTAVSAGATDSLVLTSDGKVYGFGDNSAGQLGTSGGMTTNPTPAVLPLPAGVTATQISAGGSANFILGSDGNVYATGEDDYGQAGLSPFVTAVTTPTAMSMPAGTAPVLRVVGAGISGYVITKTGQLVSWGNNADGQLGTSSTAKASLPVIVTIFNDTLDQVPIGSAGQTVFALASNVKVTNTSLPSGQAGSAYSATVTTSGGYQAGGVNTVAAAGLPSGLSLSPAGMISGTPTAAGSSTVSLTVTDPEGVTQSVALPLSIAADPNVPVPPPAPSPGLVPGPAPMPAPAPSSGLPLPTTVSGPSAAAIARAISRNLVPVGKSAAFAVLAKKGYAQSVSILAPGRLSVRWTYRPAGRHAKVLTVATGTASFSRTGTARLTVKLTRAGAALLRAGHKLPIAFTATFSRAVNRSVVAGKTGKLA